MRTWGGDEVAGCLHTWVGGLVQMVEYLPAEVPGHQRAECNCGGIADELQIADFLCDDLQTCAGAECLYLRTEDLMEGHVLQVERGSVGDGCAAQGGLADSTFEAGKGICHDVKRTWYKK
jgi:hypothetical protein